MFEYLVKIILTMSAAGSAVYLLLRLVEIPLKRHIPSSISYYLRLAVLFFLLTPLWFLPLRFGSAPQPAHAGIGGEPVIVGISPEGPGTESGPYRSTAPVPASPKFQPDLQPDFFLLGLIWLIGMGIYFLSGGIRLIRYRRTVSRLETHAPPPDMKRCLQEALDASGMSHHPEIRVCTEVTTPMLTGVFSPVILLPETSFPPEQLTLILTHELLHYKRKDLWFKAIAYLANGIHWLNPFCWLYRREVNLLCELSCDEGVAAGLDMNKKKEYGRAILQILSEAKINENPLCATFGSGKRKVKRRLELIMKSKTKTKRSFALAFCATVLLTIAGLAAGCGLSPEAPVRNDSSVQLNDNTSIASSEENIQALAHEAEDALGNSIQLKTDGAGNSTLSFQIPESLPEGGKLFLFVTGRVWMEELQEGEEPSEMSCHLFAQETADNSWEPGKTYQTSFAADSMLELTLYFTLTDEKTGDVLADRKFPVIQPSPGSESEWKRISFSSPLGSVPLDVTNGYDMEQAEWKLFHNGIDFKADYGAPIYSVLDGTVVFAGWDAPYGLLVRVDCGDGLETWYAHCSKLDVSEGDTVVKGQKIAEVGATGQAAGNHLHLSLLKDETFLDPTPYLNRTLPE